MSKFFGGGKKEGTKAKFDKNKNLVEDQLRIAFKEESMQSTKLREQLAALQSEHSETEKQLARTEETLRKSKAENETIRALLSDKPEDTKKVFSENEALRAQVLALQAEVASLKQAATDVAAATTVEKNRLNDKITKLKQQNAIILEEKNKFEKIVNESKLGQLDQNFKDKTMVDMQKECHAIFHKQIELLPCHKDLPRLAKNMIFIDMDGNIVAEPSPDAKIEDNIKTLLVGGTGRLDGAELKQELMDKWLEFVPERENKDLIKCLNLVLKDLLPEDSKIVGVLKAGNQSVIAPIVGFLQDGLREKLPFNSAKNGWRIQVLIGESSIHVTHKRTEQQTTESAETWGEFTFEWHIDFILNSTASELTDMKVMLKKVTVAESKNEKKIRELLEEGFARFTTEDNLIKLDTGVKDNQAVKIV